MNRPDPRVLDAFDAMRTFFAARGTLTDEFVVEAYMDALIDYPPELVVAAIKAALKHYTFFPSLSELLDIIADTIMGSRPNVDEAWVEVQREARRVGYNRPPEFHAGQFYENPGPTFTDPMIAAAVESVGWRTICLGDNSKGDVHRSFVFAYKRQMDEQRKVIKAGRTAGELQRAIADARERGDDLSSIEALVAKKHPA